MRFCITVPESMIK